MDSPDIEARMAQQQRLLSNTRNERAAAERKLTSLMEFYDAHGRQTEMMRRDLTQRRTQLNAVNTDTSRSKTLSSLVSGFSGTLREGEAQLNRRDDQANTIRTVIHRSEDRVRVLKEQERMYEEMVNDSRLELATALKEEAIQ